MRRGGCSPTLEGHRVGRRLRQHTHHKPGGCHLDSQVRVGQGAPGLRPEVPPSPFVEAEHEVGSHHIMGARSS